MDPLGTIDRRPRSRTCGTTIGSLATVSPPTTTNRHLTYTVHANGANGSVTIGDTFTYTPNADSHADIDTFTVTVNGGHGSTTNVVIAVDTVPMWYHAIAPPTYSGIRQAKTTPARQGWEFLTHRTGRLPPNR